MSVCKYLMVELAAVLSLFVGNSATADTIEQTTHQVVHDEPDAYKIIAGHSWKRVSSKACSSTGECTFIGKLTPLTINYHVDGTFTIDPPADDRTFTYTIVNNKKLIERIKLIKEDEIEDVLTHKIEDLTDTSFTLVNLNDGGTDTFLYRNEFRRVG